MKTNDGIEQIIERGCGLDVHKDNVVVSIRGIDIKPQTRIPHGKFQL
jgi:hypothetical protein